MSVELPTLNKYKYNTIQFNFFIAWTFFMKLGTLVVHVHGYKTLPHTY